jgi:uncharacterized protein (DUF1810 family)
MTDSFDLQRFVDAQAAVYSRVIEDPRRGRKQSHWMWFIFPQIAGLGLSEIAQRFALSSREEALDYLAHPLLGSRLRECSCSSITLFNAVGSEPLFSAALAKFFHGKPTKGRWNCCSGRALANHNRASRQPTR